MRDVLLLVIMMTVALLPTASAVDPNWVVTVDEEHPYLGDPVEFKVATSMALYGIHYVNLKIRNAGGDVVHSDFFQLASNGTGGYIWETSLHMEPVNYTAEFTLNNIVIGRVNITLVYDELDYAWKTILELRKDMEWQNERIRLARENANIAYNKADHFIRRWGIFTISACFLSIFVMLRAGSSYVRDAFLRGGLTSRSWERIFSLQTGGDLSLIAGHEDMVVSEPEHVRGDYCERCHTFVREGSLHNCGKRVRPKRRVKVVAR